MTSIYLEYDVREYFERIVPLKGRRVLDWGCNHGNMLKYQPCDFDYTGVDIDRGLIEQNKMKWPEHNWIHFNGHNHQYNPTGGHAWPELPEHDLVLMFSIFTHMDVAEMKSYINLMTAPLLSTFIPTNDEEKLKRALGYRLTPSLAQLVKDMPYAYVSATPESVVIYENIEDMPKMENVWYFLALHHPDYMSQFGKVIDTPFTEGIRSTQLCLSVE